MSTELNCRQCNSPDTQRMSLAYENGLSDVNTTSRTSMTFLSGGGLGIGGGKTRTSGTSQTALSQRAAPPSKKKFLKPLLWIGIAGPLVLSYICEAIMSPHVGDIVMGTLVVGGLLGWIVYATRYNKEKWPPLKAIWDKSFICLRCGTTFQHN